jgi:hypothetical protein
MAGAFCLLITFYLFNAAHRAVTPNHGRTTEYNEAANWQCKLQLVFGFPITKGDVPVTGSYKP